MNAGEGGGFKLKRSLYREVTEKGELAKFSIISGTSRKGEAIVSSTF